MKEKRSVSRSLHWKAMNCDAFSYDPKIKYDQNPLVQIGRMNQPCRYCGAMKWINKMQGMCCNNEKVKLELLEEPTNRLKTLMTGETNKSKHFLKNIRK